MNKAPDLRASRRSLSNALAHFFDGIAAPASFCPPGGASLGKGAYQLSGPLRLIARSFAFDDNVERRRELASCVDVGFHGPDVVWCDSGLLFARVKFVGQQAVVTQGTLH